MFDASRRLAARRCASRRARRLRSKIAANRCACRTNARRPTRKRRAWAARKKIRARFIWNFRTSRQWATRFSSLAIFIRRWRRSYSILLASDDERQNVDRAASAPALVGPRSDSVRRFSKRLDLRRQLARRAARSVFADHHRRRQDLARASDLRGNPRGRDRELLVRYAENGIAC